MGSILFLVTRIVWCRVAIAAIIACAVLSVITCTILSVIASICVVVCTWSIANSWIWLWHFLVMLTLLSYGSIVGHIIPNTSCPSQLVLSVHCISNPSVHSALSRSTIWMFTHKLIVVGFIILFFERCVLILLTIELDICTIAIISGNTEFKKHRVC